MARAALFVGGPYHLRKMKLPDKHDQYQVRHMDPLDAHLLDSVKANDEMKIRTLTYRPRQWLNNEVWVLDGLSDSAALDMLITSAFNKRKR